MHDLSPGFVDSIASVLFAVALVHTFSTRYFERLARSRPGLAWLFHPLSEVEVVFAAWSAVLLAVMLAAGGAREVAGYLASRHFTEPIFVFVIMVVAGSRPILELAEASVLRVVRLLPLPAGMATYLVVLSVVPLLGSLVTEPAAMTLAALMIRDAIFSRPASTRLRYATLGVLFVNVSIGGTLTPFAAPPVLMVAAKWNWDAGFMLSTFGWRSALAVVFNAVAATWLFRRELVEARFSVREPGRSVPRLLTLGHLAILAGVVAFAGHAGVFLPLFVAFLGMAWLGRRHQSRLVVREGLLVALFLAGLVVLGGKQQWWLQPLLAGMDEHAVFLGATLLTAVTDNAALTYLGSLVQGLGPEFKVALVAGAVAGGGLTVVANAPNPAGVSILRDGFPEGVVRPLGLLVAALPPTLVAVAALRLL